MFRPCVRRHNVAVSDLNDRPDEPAAEPAPQPEVSADGMRERDAKEPDPAIRPPEELNLTPNELYEFITSDFESAWAAFAAMQPAPGRNGRGNMMFARQAMTLLEFACRLYGQDARARSDFSAALFDIDGRYFTEMPGRCGVVRSLLLPFHPAKGPDSADRTMLAALFDLTRHGLAHQYQNITVQLTDRRILAVSVSGAKYGDTLGSNTARANYLGYLKAQYNDVLLRLYPDTLYLDLKEALARARLLERGLRLTYLARGGDGASTYQFDAASLEAALDAGGHARVIGMPGR
jgi:hypothetical protein